ncbi:MAG: hypothetical protein QM765_29870 [Myxococcales bacterium]
MASQANSIVRTNRNLGLPDGLPVTVAIEEIASQAPTSTTPNITVPVDPKWHDYRQVLVKIENVKVATDNDPSCNWSVQKSDGSGSSLMVIDDVLFKATSCPNRPVVDTVFGSVTGFSTWSISKTALAPRSDGDLGGCDPLGQECGTLGCYLVTEGAWGCAPVGTVARSQPCGAPNACLKGFACVYNNVEDVCMQVCNPLGGSPSCTIGTCTAQGSYGLCL